MLLPTDDTAIRRSLDQWFEKQDLRPVMIGEFEDYAMLREFARGGHGFFPVPSILEEQFCKEYGVARVGSGDRHQGGVLCHLRGTQDQESRGGRNDRTGAATHSRVKARNPAEIPGRRCYLRGPRTTRASHGSVERMLLVVLPRNASITAPRPCVPSTTRSPPCVCTYSRMICWRRARFDHREEPLSIIVRQKD